MEKNLGGRPTKLTEKFKKVAEEVISKNILACTDEDIIFLINDRLDSGEQISDATWENWKAGKIEDDERRSWFLGLVKRSLIIERDNLIQNLQGDNKAWQRWAWIIERKFKEWRMINEFSGKIKHDGQIDSNVTIDLSKLSDDEVDQLTKLTNKATTE